MSFIILHEDFFKSTLPAWLCFTQIGCAPRYFDRRFLLIYYTTARQPQQSVLDTVIMKTKIILEVNIVSLVLKVNCNVFSTDGMNTKLFCIHRQHRECYGIKTLSKLIYCFLVTFCPLCPLMIAFIHCILYRPPVLFNEQHWIWFRCFQSYVVLFIFSFNETTFKAKVTA